MCGKSLLATGNAAAIAIALLTLCVLSTVTYVSAMDTGAPAESLNIVAAEVQQFKIDALTRIDNFLQHKVPERVLAQGEAIRAETVQQLERCAQLATSKDELWRFKQCAAEELGKALQSLGLLVHEAYNGGSVAGHAICLNLLLFVIFLLK